ncbi:hypothetical protein [Methylohalobius crimeensis]|uniref:hypothetical protein n=1 Tax=Methylohalobius crimeensis TaxID=244365 RepID=UPI0003B4C4C1|nr:hypothetical protein [Methylohalobius crimeensis]
MYDEFFRIFKPLAITVAGSLVLLSAAQADQPHAVDWTVLKQAESGFFKPGVTPDGDDRVWVQLANDDRVAGDTPLLVTFPECDYDPKVQGKAVWNLDEIIRDPSVNPEFVEYKTPDPRWSVCPDRKFLLLYPGEKVELELNVDFLRPVSEGMSPRLMGTVYQVSWSWAKKIDDAEELARYKDRVHPAATVTLDLYYRLDADKSVWQAGDYQFVFGSPSEGPGVTRDYERVREVMPVDVRPYVEKRRLPEVPVKPGYELPLERVYEAGSGSEQERMDPALDLNSPDSFLSPKLGLNAPVVSKSRLASHGAYSHTLSGIFSTKWSADHSLHPGFGFRVEAWTNENGSWEKLASDWVQYNGHWTLKVPAGKGYRGDHLRVLYRSYNRYYQPQNQNGDTYSWRDPDQYDIGSDFYAGHRYADTDGGEFNSVGELVDAAMNTWSRLYWDAEIDPVASDPIKFHFPNTWNNCSGSSPWSCASWDGLNIWLIASHGRQADVVTHEMAHALQGKFWDEKWPAGSGGSHTLSGCYSGRLGMALTEGFANFMPAWVGYPARNVADGGFNGGRWALDFDAEQRTSPPNCSNGWENEVWVARTFWDLHDTHADGDDILWFIHKGAVISLYLGNAVANDGDAMDMRDFENVYRNAASSGHEGFVSDIFDQNRM